MRNQPLGLKKTFRVVLSLAALCVGSSARAGAGGFSSVGEAIQKQRAAVSADQQTVANDQSNVAAAQQVVSQDQSATVVVAACPGCGFGSRVPYCQQNAQQCDNDAAALASAQSQLASDQGALQTDQTQLQQLQAMAGGTDAPDTADPQTRKALTGGALDPFQAQTNGARVAAINLNPSAQDLAKLRDPVPGAEEQAQEPGYQAASVLALGTPRRAGPDLLNARVTVPGFSPATASPAPDLARSADTKLRMADYQGALEDSLGAIRAAPDDPLGYLRAAQAYNKLRRYGEAEGMARQAVARDPDNAEAWKNLAWALLLLKNGRYKDALDAALIAARLRPDMAEAWAIAAYASGKLGDQAARLAYLEKAAALDARYQTKLAAARRGEDDDFLLDEAAGAPEKSPGPRDALPIGVGLLALLGGLSGWRLRRKLRAAKKRTLRSALAEIAPVEPVAASGEAIGKYKLGMIIGRGGMGEVYMATDVSLGRQVAVKKMTRTLSQAGAQARELFIREARVVAQLQHPAIVDVYEVFDFGGDIYVVFELLRGKTAHQLLAESRRLPLARVRDLLKPVCAALDYAHERQLVHRDLKPANIMELEDGRVKLMDFGVARSLADARRTSSGGAARTPGVFARTVHAVGTPAYMPPEADQGLVCKEGDVFSLGVTAYELLTGQLPFGALASSWEKARSAPAPASARVPGLTPAVDAVLARALRARPEERFRSAGELAAALDDALISGTGL